MTVRVKLAAVCLLAFLAIGVASAEAFVWHMRYGQAKNATKAFARESCNEDTECLGWGTGQCYRKSQSRFDCEMALFYAGIEPGEEIECNILLHWGASHSGYVTLKNHGRPYCFAV